MMRRRTTISFAVLAGFALTGCPDDSSGGTTEPAQCSDAEKCDTPGGTDDEQCRARQSEVLSSSQRGFQPNAVRWACADVEGVNTVSQDDRGQEYCEYWAIVQPPGQEGDPQAFDLGRPLGSGVTDLAICVEGDSAKDCRTTITEDQLALLEDDPSSVVGACVFSSWHADVPGPLPVCADGGCGTDAELFGFPLDADTFRMKVSFNSNGAAADLVQRCLEGDAPQPEDFNDASDPLVEPFFRGCMEVQGIFGTGWRRSDPSVCAAVNRLDECGCGVPGVDREDLPRAIVPPQPAPDGSITLRGFPLGTWDKPAGLPGGCRYVEIGEESRTIVACDLTAADVLSSLNDPKEACRATYGPNVVVHVPIPADAIECSPPDSDVGKTCGSQPWNIGAEGASTEPAPEQPSGECCKTCTTSQACGDACISNDATCNVGPGCACQG